MTQDFPLSRLLAGDTNTFTQALALVAKASRQTPEQLRLALANQLLEPLWQELDPQLQPLLTGLNASLAQWLAADDGIYLQPQHPLRQLLEQLYTHLSHWCPRDSKPSQQFYDKLSQALAEASIASLEAFVRWADGEAQRAAMLAQRLGDSEAGQLRQIACECQVIALLNEQLAGHQLPLELADPLERYLKSELQHCLLSPDGDQAPLWRLWQKLLPHLGQVFPADSHGPEDQLLYSLAPALIAELERSLQLPLSNPGGYHLWVEHLCQALMGAVQKKTPESAPLPALAYPEGYSQSASRITHSLLQQSQALERGDWLVFTQDNTQVRAMLAYKNPDAGQLLFVDQAGRKLMSKSHKDMALSLSTGAARPLAAINLKERIHPLLGKLASQAQKIALQQQAAAEARAQQAAAEQAARQQAEAEAAERALQQQLEVRRAASRKAMAEARALAEEKERRAAEAARLREQQQQAALAEAEARRLAAESAVNSLRVGAWLELEQNPGQALRCKLSVILASSGKYIFVDQVGRKLAELQREQLLELMQANQLRLLRQGGDFEDQLAKVIRGLRKDITP